MALRSLSSGMLAALLALVLPANAWAQNERSAVDEILRVVPADAHAAIIVPSLKRLSDDLTRLLEGMDRANILLGSRPIDHFKSITGFTTALNDTGSAAMVVLDAAARPPRIAWILPVTSAEQFLEGTFAEHGVDGQPDAHRRTAGPTYYAKSLHSHIVLSDDADAARSFDSGEGLAAAIIAALSDHASLINSGEVMIVLRPPAIGAIKQSLLEAARDFNVVLPAAAMLAEELAADADTVVMTLDCDPLALVVRGVARFKADADFGKLALAAAQAEANADPGLARLPNKPFALALSVNLATMGGAGLVHGVAEAVQPDPDSLPQWLTKTNSFQFAVATSDAGPAGGLLNEAMFVAAADDPAALREAIKQDVLATQNHPAIKRAAKWTENQTLPNGGELTADAWEVRTLDAPPELAHIAALETMLFGAAGMRGYVRQEAQAVLVTFSQRPAVLAALRESVQQTSGAPTNTQAAGFAANPAVRIIRQWLPSQRDIELYVHAEPMREMLARSLAAVPGAANRLAAVPAFGAALPPVGTAIDVAPQTAEAAMVIPRDVLVPLFDELMRRLPGRRDDATQPAR